MLTTTFRLFLRRLLLLILLVELNTGTTRPILTPQEISTAPHSWERSYNLGCSGYRKVLISAEGTFKYAPCGTPAQYLSIMSQMPKGDMQRRYYLFDQTENVFDVTQSINDTAYTGFDYKEQIFSRTLSNIIYLDPKKIPILDRYQRVVFALIESVKQIKNYFNYTVPFNNRRVF